MMGLGLSLLRSVFGCKRIVDFDFISFSLELRLSFYYLRGYFLRGYIS